MTECRPKTQLATAILLLVLLVTGTAVGTGIAAENGVRQALREGDYARALAAARQAVEISSTDADSLQHLDALIDLAQTYQAAGQHGNALDTLQSALRVAGTLDDPARRLLVMAGLGQSYAQAGQATAAQHWLRQTVEAAAQQQRPRVEATALNNLGNLLQRNSRYREALDAYLECIAITTQHESPLLQAQATANAARAALALQDGELANRLFMQTVRSTKSLPPSHDAAYLLINSALLPIDSSAAGAASHRHWRQESYTLLEAAQRMAERIGDARAGSYALGYLARLYLDQGRTEEALTLTRKAEFIAQQHSMPDSLFRWQWQAGRILDRQGRSADAIEAYRQAVRTLQPIRYDIAGGAAGGSAFRDVIGPLYFELTDLLLRHPQDGQDLGAGNNEQQLQEARNIVELFKAAELEDFFDDDCVAQLQARTASLDSVEPDTAVIYPILLPDRTELLVSLSSGIRQFTVDVDAGTVVHEIRGMRSGLEKRTSHDYMAHARQLYDWLLRPIADALQEADIDTLVIVPDGALRTIPWAALHDGAAFLVERYAIAYTPGLQVTDPRPLQRENLQLLLSGLSTAVQDFPALPYVENEIDSIQQVHGGTVLLNESYRSDSMREALDDTPYSIVHIASHGQFSSEPDNTFLLTYSDRIDMDELGEFVGIGRFRDKPVELLTLSACQTAAGDDRAALGLAGVAVKSGARSALATLWFVNDRTTALLITEFYRNLGNASLSKARALQQAQIHLLEDRRYRHPGYWSPYLLIGNWL